MSRESSVADREPQELRQPSQLNEGAIRCLDAAGATIGLALLSPVLLGLAAAIRATSPGPALFKSVRVGQDGRPFVMYKLRSMRVGSQTAGPAITTAGDQRITPLGAVLRRFKLDELPQLLNVLKGDMSLVGPRPEDPAYVARYSRKQMEILATKPGMTSPASLNYRSEETQLIGESWERQYVEQIMPAKLDIDLAYLRGRTPASDLKVLLATARVLLRRGSGD